MAKIVTILNFKGGVGKTTCAVEIAVSLARFYGRRALLIDLDPQASATFYLMEQERWKQWREVHGSTFNLFEQNNHRFYIRNAIVPDVVQGRTAVFGFDLLPSDPNLVDVDLRLSDFIGYTVLQRYLDEIRDEYDYIICDCPPTFNKQIVCAYIQHSSFHRACARRHHLDSHQDQHAPACNVLRTGTLRLSREGV